jgi:hypothetical protein
LEWLFDIQTSPNDVIVAVHYIFVLFCFVLNDVLSIYLSSSAGSPPAVAAAVFFFLKEGRQEIYDGGNVCATRAKVIAGG